MTAKQITNNKKMPPLLVTGAHRSGTTWVGKMIAASGKYAYISEPLNVNHRQGIFHAVVPYWYNYINSENEDLYLPAFRDTLRLHYHTIPEVKSLRSIKDLGRFGRDCWRFTIGRLAGRAPLLKDPFALFSAPWFSDRLGCQVVICVRHPAAFISSLKRLGWTFNFSHLLDQPQLMQDLLSPFEDELHRAQQHSADLILRGSLLWNILYHVVDLYRRRDYPFLIVRHEDLSLQPIAGYKSIYQWLGLPFASRIEDHIRMSSSQDNPVELSGSKAHSIKLDSRANLKNWRKRLSNTEIARIRELTADVASHFYTSADW